MVYAVIAVLVLAVIVLIIYIFYQRRRQEKKIQELTDYLTRVQDFSELPAMSEICEGRLGILQSEIYKVVTILKEEYFSEHKQKKYMSDMMSDISHQFKTPLSAITLMTDLLMGEDVTDEQRLEYVSKIESQVSKMTWLIRNLLTLSQLEAGVLEMRADKLAAGELVDEMADSLEVMAEAAEVELKFRIPEGIFITGDGHWLREALTNIIKNSIEHTPAGGLVSMEVSDNNIFTAISIKDNGKGIAEEHLPHIFERFYKAGNTSKNSVGIGLAMAKQIINLHGGTIEVESREGVGTGFTIRLYHSC
ncbi:MAG: HAMP domain-containing histidine kinase [Lachnospiraceae bacterium]|nr:HAMP domain-containing histidine kinase [Lachnospiraceae bacterium]